MTTIRTYAARGSATADTIAALDEQMQQVTGKERMVFAFYGCGHDDQALHDFLRRRFPAAAVMGGSSSGGFITERGFMDERSIGLLAIDDEPGDYGAAASRLGEDAAATAESLLQQAIASCGCTGELPELIWVYQAPGREEAVIEGLRRVVGDLCPIIGGSSADNDVSGRWRQMGPGGPLADGVAVGVMFPSAPLGYAFQGGYEPAGPSGIVTGIGGGTAATLGVGRDILSIDGQPAAEVYNRWIDGRIGSCLRAGGTILAETTMFPLATDAGRVDGVSHYLLIHPESVGPGGVLRTFCNLELGSRVYAMKGDRDRLVNRAGRVADQARRTLPDAGIAGGLVVYCGGCKLAVGDEIARIAGEVARGLGQAPFIGCFTFGEQGRMIDRNVHGNLMISAVAFGR